MDDQTVASDASSTPARARVIPPGVLAPALAAGLCLVLVLLTWSAFIGTSRGQQVDDAARIGSAGARDWIGGLTELVLNAVSVPLLVVVLAIAVLISLLQRRWSIAIAAIMMLAGSNLTTQILKDVLLRPDGDVARVALNSFPSGHVTVAASISVTALLVVSVRWRSIVALIGAILTATMGVATMVGTTTSGAWHRLSDVLASVLITGAWYFLVEAVLAGVSGVDKPAVVQGRWEMWMSLILRVFAVIGGLTGGLALGALGATTIRAPIETTVGYQVAFAGAVAAVLCICSLVFGLMLRLRPHHPHPQRPPEIPDGG